nr:MAG TPA: hypothetical protein [Caudoviricetes sp.]
MYRWFKKCVNQYYFVKISAIGNSSSIILWTSKIIAQPLFYKGMIR